MNPGRLQSKPPNVQNAAVGLIANGSAGSWDVAVDETVTGAEKWFLQIEGPAFYLYFAIEGPPVVQNIVSFLESHQTPSQTTGSRQAVQPNGELEAGCFGRAPVSFIWDEEGQGRLFILVSGTDECRSRLSVSDSELRHFMEALRQVRDSLAEESLLA